MNPDIPPRDTTSTHCRTADTDIRHCMQCITGMPHSVLAGDVGAHSTLWRSCTDDHRGQLMADVISNSDHMALDTDTDYGRHRRHTSPRCLAHFAAGHRGQLGTHCRQTTYPWLPQLACDMTADYNGADGPLPTTRKQTGHNLQKTQSPLLLRPQYPPTYTLPTEFSQTSY